MLAKSLPSTHWHRPILTTAAIVTFARAAIGLYQPDYWEPRTPLDYAAVAGTSLSFLFLAIGLWGFFLHHPASPGRAGTVWRSEVTISCIAAATIALINYLEDALDVNGLGWVWVIGILVLLASILVAGISVFWAQGLPRWTSAALLAAAVGILFVGSAGFFGLGLALLALGVLDIH